VLIEEMVSDAFRSRVPGAEHPRTKPYLSETSTAIPWSRTKERPNPVEK
jgi:hypothetical protein